MKRSHSNVVRFPADKQAGETNKQLDLFDGSRPDHNVGNPTFRDRVEAGVYVITDAKGRRIKPFRLNDLQKRLDDIQSHGPADAPQGV